MSNLKQLAIKNGMATRQGRTLLTSTFGIDQVLEKRPYVAIQRDLREAATSEMIRQKEGNDYVGWYNTATIFDLIAPGWTNEIVHQEITPMIEPVVSAKNRPKANERTKVVSYVILQMAIHIPCTEGTITRIGYGMEAIKDYGGDAFSIAASQAFRKAAAMHGFARPLWYKDDEGHYPDEQFYEHRKEAEIPPPLTNAKKLDSTIKNIQKRVAELLEAGDLAAVNRFLDTIEAWTDTWPKKEWAKSAIDAVSGLYEFSGDSREDRRDA